jgi:hypothetical protein
MSSRARLAAVALAAALLAPSAASAKVVFTGYGDFRLNAHTPLRVYGDAPALATLGLTDTTEHHTRGFNLQDVGLFATTTLADNMDFKVDFNYRNIGQTVNQLRLQYAYLEHRLDDGWSYRAGKVTLPFGYYNENRFYSFQRVELQTPIFQTAVLGLPIADVGVSARKVLGADRAGTRWVFDGYAVNGYGANPNNTNAFRTVAALGGITIANNLTATNNNANIAFGGRVAAANIADKPMEAGLSYYGGAWDTGGSRYFQMWDAHYRLALGRVDFLTELQHFDVSGDQGFAAALNDTHWQTSGYFMTLDLNGFSVASRPLTPYVGAEGYQSRGHRNSGSQEKLQDYRAGAELKPLENLALKAEYAYLFYALPVANTGEIRLWAHQVLAALVLTF